MEKTDSSGKLIYKEESYLIVGCCYKVFNELGPGLREINYQNALIEVFRRSAFPFQSQVYVPIKLDGKNIGKYYFDFLLFDKIIVEIKTGNHFHRRDIEQTYSYLRKSKLKLGILVNFTSNGVHHRRILNTY